MRSEILTHPKFAYIKIREGVVMARKKFAPSINFKILKKSFSEVFISMKFADLAVFPFCGKHVYKNMP